MWFFDIFKKKKIEEDDKKYGRVSGLDWYSPIYSQFGSDIYASDVVQQAIQCIVKEMKKLELQHVRKTGDLQTIENDNIQSILDNPNELMTTSDFIEKVVWQLYFNYNSFILPVWEGGQLTGLYPLQPSQVDFLEDSTGEYFVKLTFANGYKGTIKYSDVIHIRYNYSVSEFMGGNKSGQPDNKALLESLKLNDTLLKGVAKALNSSFAVNAIVKYNTMIDDGKTEKALEKLTKALKNNESGFLPLDLKAEMIPFNRQIQLVDDKTLKFIDEKILRFFGVPLCILTGDYTKAQYEAFYQKTLEPLIVSMSQAFTKAIFSRRETKGFGHKIVFSHKLMDFMTMAEKIQFVTVASNVGGITIDEFRTIFGFVPFGGDLGKTPIMSKNYGNAESVKDIDKNENSDDNSNNNSDDSSEDTENAD